MLVKKIINISIDLFKPEEIYSSNINQLLINKINEKYVGRCYLSILIIEVNRIIQRSDIIMAFNQLNGAASVDVKFEVTGVILVPDVEILHNCRITEIYDKKMIAEHKYADIQIQSNINSISQMLSIGSKIPVVVRKCQYSINKKTISVIAVPYFPQKTPSVIYKITKGLVDNQIEQLNELNNMILEEEKNHKMLAEKYSKTYDFFIKFLYPFKEVKDVKLIYPTFVPSEFNLKNIPESGFITYPSEDNRHNKRFFIGKDFKEIKNCTVVDVELFGALYDIYNKYYMYLQCLSGFVETYSDVSNFKTFITYAKICNNMKS